MGLYDELRASKREANEHDARNRAEAEHEVAERVASRLRAEKAKELTPELRKAIRALRRRRLSCICWSLFGPLTDKQKRARPLASAYQMPLTTFYHHGKTVWALQGGWKVGIYLVPTFAGSPWTRRTQMSHRAPLVKFTLAEDMRNGHANCVAAATELILQIVDLTEGY